MSVALSEIALCTPDDVKSMLGGVVGTEGDDTVRVLINSISKAASGKEIMNRPLAYKQRAEFFDGGGRVITVDAPPFDMEKDIVVWDDPSRAFTDTNLILPHLDAYSIPNNGEFGQIKKICGGGSDERFRKGQRSVQVGYWGGLVLWEADQLIRSPDDIRYACAFQAADFFKHRNHLGLKSMSAGGGAMTEFTPLDLLPWVLKVFRGSRHHK